MTATLCLLLGQMSGRKQPAGILVRAADINQALGADCRNYLIAEGADAQVGISGDVARSRASDGLAAQLACIELLLLATTIKQQGLVVTIKLEVPVRVGSKPVVVTAVEHDGVVIADAAL